MTPPRRSDPCLEVLRLPPLGADDRIRVVELVATGTNGGAQEHVASLLSRIDRDRYDVRVVSLSDGSATRRWRSTGIPVEVIRDQDDGAAVAAVVERLVADRTQVLHGHMFRAEVVGTRAAAALRTAGRPAPFVLNTVHSSRPRSRDDRELLVEVTPSMDGLIAVSRSIVAMLASQGRTTVPVHLIYNGVDLARYDVPVADGGITEELGLGHGDPLVGVVGRLGPEKGHATLLDAWPIVLRDVPGARLLIVGEGSQRDWLQARAGELGLPWSDAADRVPGNPVDRTTDGATRSGDRGASVIFAGRREDVPAVTAAFDVAVLPSYREAQGLVILEAMALSRPVVASNVGGIPEMIDDGVTGLLVPPRDAEALAAAITRLLLDRTYAASLAAAAHEVVHDRFCVERMVGAIQELYEEGAATYNDRERHRRRRVNRTAA